MIYRMKLATPSYLCDIDDRLHPWAAVRLCQEVTEYHGNATGIGFKVLLQQNRAWVITRAYYDIQRLPMAFEEIMLSTWSRGHNGLIAYRDYRMETPDGETLLTGTSAWPMIDMTTRRVLRLNEVIEGYESHPQQATRFETLPKLRMPTATEPATMTERQVVYTMLDHTRHVNNSEYIKMIFDTLEAEGFDSSRPFCLDMSYQHETRAGELMQLTHVADGTTDWFRIDNPRGTSVTARVAHSD